MAFIDYYKIMGVDKNIPQSDIRAAYLRRAKQFHPDLHPDDPKAKVKFQALNEANAVLSDPAKRAKYDKYGEHWQQAEAFEQAGGAHGKGFNPGFGDGGNGANYYAEGDFSRFAEGNGDFSSFFEDLFGGEYSNAGEARGNRFRAAASGEMNVQVDIDLYTALLGGELILQTKAGKLKLHVQPCTQNGAKVRLRGKGYQRADGTYGNMIITYNVRIPRQLNERQRKLVEQLKAAE